MPSNYTPVIANAVAKKLVLSQPVDGDARNAASVTAPLDQLADLNELLLEHIATFVSSNWIAGTGASGSMWAVATANTLQASTAVVQSVAVGASGAIQSSPDSKAWTTRTSGTTNQLRAVAFNGSLWVAVGDNSGAGGSGTVTTSPDGITWTLRTSTLATTNLWTVSWSSALSQWVAAGATGTLFTSTDGTTWTARTSNITGTIVGSAFGAGIWVVCQGSGATNHIATSTDGITWTARTVVSGGLINLLFASGQFVAFDSASPSTPYVSTNGTSWSAGTILPSGGFAQNGGALAWNGRHYVLLTVVGAANVRVWGSIDAKVWSERPLDDISIANTPFGLAANSASGQFVAVGQTLRFASFKHPPT